MDFVSIPAGVLLMGSTADQVDRCVEYWGTRLVDPSYQADQFQRWILKEYPQHPVPVAAFRLGRFPVTNAEYRPFAEASGRPLPESLTSREPEDHPVWGVLFEDAASYAAWLGARLGCRCRLPTEAEWEYAARGLQSSEYPFGDEFDPTRCNTIESGIGHTTPVDRYHSGVSEFGLYDLAGNVEEWTADYYRPYPGGEFIADDLTRRLGHRYRVLRGGSFARGGDLARCARRHGPYPSPEFRYRGFRVAVDAEE
jgi:formylglycine-generating enzyme required for sulfatase activity